MPTKKPAGRPLESGPSKKDTEQIAVVLRPLFGIVPSIYVPVIYGLLLLVLLFVLLLLPGLRRYGSVVAFDSRPQGAAIYIDGNRIGATPSEAFVAAGTHRVELRLPYFASEEEGVELGGRRFGSLFWPRRTSHLFNLQLIDEQGLIEEAAGDFAAWALIGTATAQYQFAPTLSTAVLKLTGANRSGQRSTVGAAATTLLENSLADVASDALLRDFLNAYTLAHGAGLAASPLTLIRVLAEISGALERHTGLPFLLQQALSPETAELFRRSEWFADFVDNYITDLLPATHEQPLATRSFENSTIAGMPFVAIPGGEFVMGSMAADADPNPLLIPHIVRAPALFVGRTEVTQAQFARFVAERPEWGIERRAELIMRGLVSEDYLADWDPRTPNAALPANGISWFAAQAFAEWLQAQLPASLGGYRARLPDEREWEWIAYYASADAYPASLRPNIDRLQAVATNGAPAVPIYDLLGNVWEWNRNWYHPLQYTLQDNEDEIAAELPGAARALRGGSWIEERRTLGIETRGSLPPQWSSPNIGFRLVLVRE